MPFILVDALTPKLESHANQPYERRVPNIDVQTELLPDLPTDRVNGRLALLDTAARQVPVAVTVRIEVSCHRQQQHPIRWVE
ncbi:MAG: hypothetical protein ABIZ52_05130 [Candidatus Limnocylindrales bacterium]